MAAGEGEDCLSFSESCSNTGYSCLRATTEAVVVGRFGFIGRWNGAQHRGSLQGFLLAFLGGRHADDVVVGPCLGAGGETASRRSSGACAEVPLEV